MPPVSRSELRWEFLNIAAAIALLSIAFVAIALFFFRRKTRDLTLIYFSLFCILYAVRLLTTVRSFRSLFDQPPTFWKYLNWDITSTLLIPFGLFFYQVGGEYFRKSLRWLVAAQMLFAVFGIFAAALGISLAKLNVAMCSSYKQTFWVSNSCLEITWSLSVSWYLSDASVTSLRTASLQTKSAFSPSTKSWKSRAEFSPQFFRKLSPLFPVSILPHATLR